MTDNILPFGEAKKAAKRRARSKEDVVPEEIDIGSSPVIPIGTAAGAYWFFQANGEMIAHSARDLGAGPVLLSLFGGNSDWLAKHFPAFTMEGKPTNWFTTKHVNAWLVRECTERGLFDPGMPQRGVGVWRAGSAMVLHTGKTVRHVAADGTITERPAGFVAWDALWPRQAAVRPPGEPAPADHAHWLLGLMERWTWEHPGEASIFFGLWATGLLGAAIRWRPHGLVVGGAGTGKSSLMELYETASPMAFASNDFTEPGLRQNLSGRATPLVLDEAEGDMDGTAKMQRVVQFLRLTSGGEGARTVKGSPGGTAKVFQVTVSAVLGAILPPPLQPQDASRITRMDLWPRPLDGDGLPLPDAAERDLLATRAPGLWGRALAGLPRFQANLIAVRAELLARGCVPRLADQIGTILAARDMMLSDAPMDVHAAIDSAAWLVVTEAEAQTEGGPQTCLSHLLASASEVTHGGERPTLGALVSRALFDEVPTEALRQLGEHGLRVGQWPTAGPASVKVLFVAQKHPRLSRIFEGTPWTGGRWHEDLRRLPMASVPKDPVRIGHGKPRCVVIPPEFLPSRLRSEAD